MNIITRRPDSIFLFGNPVAHSNSPLIMNAVFRKLGLNAVYIPVKVERKDLFRTLAMFKLFHYKGANLTIPFKTAFWEEHIYRQNLQLGNLINSLTHRKRRPGYLAGGDEWPEDCILAELIDMSDYDPAYFSGSVNTLYWQEVRGEDRLYGTTTDGEGFIKNLEDYGVFVSKKSVMLIGTGGAARAIGYSMMRKKNTRIYVCGRNPGKINDMCASLNESLLWTDYTSEDKESSSKCISVNCDIGSSDFNGLIPRMDLIVNATSVGMHPNVDQCILPYTTQIHAGQALADVVYNPLATEFLKFGKSRGCKTVPGLGMLLHQACGSLRCWYPEETKDIPDADILKIMRKALGYD